MDGWAVRGADVRGASTSTPVRLSVAGGDDAGGMEPPPLADGTAWRVATGGRVPAGADSVIRQEHCRTGNAAGATPCVARSGATTPGPIPQPDNLIIFDDRDAGRNVRPIGGDVAAGDLVLKSGTVVNPAVIAMLASLGEAVVKVSRPPRVAIICSGNEVVSFAGIDQVAAGERIIDANTPMLAALVRQSGGVPVTPGVVPDATEAIAAAVTGADDADVVITVGGISVGARDHVPDAMAALGARTVFRRVRVRPGGPTTLAVRQDGRPWLALPGNPVSAFVTFHLFAAPLIRAMLGDPQPLPRIGRATMGEAVQRHPVLDQYVRVRLEDGGTGALPVARLTGGQGSWVLSSIAAAHALAVVEAGEGVVDAGDEVGVVSL